MARAVLFGTPVSPGIAIGRVRFMHKTRQDDERRITAAEVAAEQETLRAAAESVRASLAATRENVPEDLSEYRDVIAAQMEMARDAKLLTEGGYAAEKVQCVDMFCWTGAVETVVLLSHKKADSYIHIDVEFGEGEGKIPVDSIAKRAEAYKPKEKVTYKMIKEYIEAKYGFKVHTAYIAEVKRNLGLPMYDAPNAVEELKQPRKHPTPEKVEAIKDALRYFAVI